MFCSCRISTDKRVRGPSAIAEPLVSARCNIYISRLCYDVIVRLSVRLSVTEVHWRIIANLGLRLSVSALITLLSRGVPSTAMTMSVCLSVCLSTRISRRPHDRTSPNFCACDRDSIFFSQHCDALPVLWITCTSRFHTMGSTVHHVS